MSTKSNIEWTDATWNPIRGCTPVSPGCKNCYASAIAKRFSFSAGPFEGLVRVNAAGQRTKEWNGNIKFVEKHYLDPLRWKKPRCIFVNSMSDLFHENVTDAVIDKIFAVMFLCPHHTFQILTKRPDRMLSYILSKKHEPNTTSTFRSIAEALWALTDIDPKLVRRHGIDPLRVAQDIIRGDSANWWPMPNVMLGTSAENQKYFNERIGPIERLHDLKWKTFLSLEPLIGPIDVEYPKSVFPTGAPMCCNGQECGCRGMPTEPPMVYAADWVIVGGESGPDARPMQSRWASDIQRACKHWKIPFFFKQQGMWIDAGHEAFGRLPAGKIAHYDSDGVQLLPGFLKLCDENSDVNTMKMVGRTRAGKTLYGMTYHEFPA